MKVIRVLTLAALLVTLFAFPAPAKAAPAFLPFEEDTVIFGQDYTLASGQVIEGSLVAFGSTVTIEAGASIENDLVVFGSDVELLGSVDRDFIAVGSDVFLGESASVGRDFIAPGTSWNRDAQAGIGRDIISETGPFQLDLGDLFGPDGINLGDGIRLGDGTNYTVPVVPNVVVRNTGSSVLNNAMWLLFRAFALSTLALMVVLFLPVPTHRVLKTISAQPVNSAGVGFVGAILTPILMLVMIITICLIPFAVGVALLAALALVFGWIVLGLEVGRRLMEAIKGDWAESIQAWVGTFVLSVVVGIVAWVPCIGWLAALLMSVLGFGAVLLTRFGTQNYPLEPAMIEAPAPEPEPKALAKKSTRKSSSKKS